MTERPIIFSAQMIRAILENRKTQTRRIVKLKQSGDCQMVRVPGTRTALYLDDERGLQWVPSASSPREPWPVERIGEVCPYGGVGDRLWVRETFCLRDPEYHPERGYWYAANDDVDNPKWTSPIHMPRHASRITLEITDVRVQRLQDISEEDAWAEGIEAVDGSLDGAEICRLAKDIGCSYEDARPSFACMWDHINGKRAPWSSNPFVWALTFKRVEER
jgi:hypothetical protein